LRSTTNYDEWTIDRWRVEPQLKGIKMPIEAPDDTSPPLWKDVTLASVVAVLMWGAVAMALG
jgi:hypothetical protein